MGYNFEAVEVIDEKKVVVIGSGLAGTLIYNDFVKDSDGVQYKKSYTDQAANGKSPIGLLSNIFLTIPKPFRQAFFSLPVRTGHCVSGFRDSL